MDKINDNLEILSKLGEGASGVVYKCKYSKDGFERIVAVKCFKKEYIEKNSKEELLREAKNLAKLNHPNIAQIYDVNLTNSPTPHIIYEFVGEKTLKDLIEEGISQEDAISIYNKLLDAVKHVHSKEIIHSDLKPSNILINENKEPKIIDFGISKGIENSSSEIFSGTLAYADPRVINKNLNQNEVSDLYALCLILYEMLTKHKFFQSNTSLELIEEIKQFKFVEETDLEDISSDYLKEYLTKCLSLDSTANDYSELEVTYNDVDQTVVIPKRRVRKKIFYMYPLLAIPFIIFAIWFYKKQDQNLYTFYVKSSDMVSEYNIKKPNFEPSETYGTVKASKLACSSLYWNQLRPYIFVKKNISKIFRDLRLLGLSQVFCNYEPFNVVSEKILSIFEQAKEKKLLNFKDPNKTTNDQWDELSTFISEHEYIETIRTVALSEVLEKNNRKFTKKMANILKIDEVNNIISAYLKEPIKDIEDCKDKIELVHISSYLIKYLNYSFSEKQDINQLANHINSAKIFVSNESYFSKILGFKNGAPVFRGDENFNSKQKLCFHYKGNKTDFWNYTYWGPIKN